jgi:hypothetical protein
MVSEYTEEDANGFGGALGHCGADVEWAGKRLGWTR